MNARDEFWYEGVYEQYRDSSMATRYAPIPANALEGCVGSPNGILRKAGDHREDSVVKAELLSYIEKDWVEDLPIAGVFEDRQQVVDMYRSKGLRVYQVAPGNF